MKGRAYASIGTAEQTASANAALRLTLDTLLRLFAPFLPFVSDEVWSWWRDGSVHATTWPQAAALRESMAAQDFDPVGGVGVDLAGARANPIVWPVRLRDMLTDAAYDRVRGSQFRMHYQYVMANDRRAPGMARVNKNSKE